MSEFCKQLFMYLAGLDLRCGVWTLQLWCVGSVVTAHGLQSAWALVVAVPGLSCSAARGIFPDQGSNLCPCIGRGIPVHRATRESPLWGFDKAVCLYVQDCFKLLVLISNALLISYTYILLVVAEFGVIFVYGLSYLYRMFAFTDELFCS